MNDPQASPIAVVTGASRGIGAAVAARLAALGCPVAGLSRTAEAPAGVLAISCDVADSAQVDQAFSRVEAELGVPQVLIVNAGINRDELTVKMSDDAWREVLEVNLTGAFNVTRRGLRGMLTARHGRIVLISSVAGLHGSAGQVNYAAAKAGLVGLGRSLAREVAGRGITVNTVHPGFIDAGMTAQLESGLLEQRIKEIPAGRLGDIDEVVAVVEFLTSARAGYVNGAIIPVDGGLGMGQ